MKNRILLFFPLLFGILFIQMKKAGSQKINSSNTKTAEPAYVYRFKDRYLDIYGLTMRDTTQDKDNKIIRHEEFHNSHFGRGQRNKADFKGRIFTLKENRDISITENGKLIKTIIDPDKKIVADNISGNSALFAVSSGVIFAIRLSEESGYRIQKFDKDGTLLNTWKIAHTIYNKQGNIIESIPHLYYFAHS